MKTLAERFWARVERTDGCWLWRGSKGRRGYGYLHRGGKSERYPARAHRLSWELHHGPIPDGLWVLHHCDNPPCVNPAHLFLGDRKDNMQDAGRKGRICTIGQAKKTECRRGHAFTSENTYRDGEGHRRCRACERERMRLRNLRKAAIDALGDAT